MKEIKGTFNCYYSHTHKGSHRTSDGFKYYYEDITDVRGPYFDQIIPLSYQDLIKLRNFASKVKSKYYSCEEDYEWADGYTSNNSSDCNKDYGLCQFFNENYSQRYGIILKTGTLHECTINIDEMPPLKCFTTAYNSAQAFQKLKREEVQTEIVQITKRLSELNGKLKIIDSCQTFQDLLLKELYLPLKNNIYIFELNKPFSGNLYPLDIAISNHDENLLDALIANGAYRYSSEFDPMLSAKCGDFNKTVEIIKNKQLSSNDVLNIFKLITCLPNSEFYSLFESKSDLIRNGRVLLFYYDKLKILASVKAYYSNRGYQSPFNLEPIEAIINILLKTKDFNKANYIYDFSRKILVFTGFYDNDMLELSFQYGNIEYIKRSDLWTLVHIITERFSYSYTYKRLEPDMTGDILQLRWNFEPYVKPENIGQELYEQIIDQIENHSQSYTCY